MYSLLIFIIFKFGEVMSKFSSHIRYHSIKDDPISRLTLLTDGMGQHYVP